MSSNGFVGFTSTDIISREPSSQHFEGNQNLGFQIVRFADGSFGIEKSIKDWTGNKTGRLYRAELLASQEYLAARVGQALNAPIRDCLFTSTNGTTVIMPFVIGQSGKELGGKDVPDDARGLQLHIFDHLVANSDRRPKNLMFTQNGIIGIDHALCNFRPRSPKPELLASLYNAGIKSNTIRELEPVLKSTKPYFAQLQMLDKFENLMFNLIRLVADLQIVEQAASVVKSVKKDAFTPPQSVQEAAQKALEWMKEGKAGSGFTPVGRKRASDLARGATVSEDTIRRMKAYFDRHQSDKKSPHWDEPSPGKVAWYAWGGDAGYSWAKSVVEKLNKVQKGDVAGHEFHGNQWVRGEAGSGWKPLSADEYAKGILQERLDAVERICKGENASYRERMTPIILAGSPETVLAQAKNQVKDATIFRLDGSKATLVVRDDANLSSDQIKGIASQLSTLEKSFPDTVDTLTIGKNIDLIPTAPKGQPCGGVTAYNKIYINANVVGKSETMENHVKSGWSPKSSDGMSKLDYTVIHEFGHALMNATPPQSDGHTFSPETTKALADNPFPSTYSLRNDLEAYAECFADYFCSKGLSDQPMTVAVAQSENWKEKLGY
jgi:hypothetical protein